MHAYIFTIWYDTVCGYEKHASALLKKGTKRRALMPYDGYVGVSSLFVSKTCLSKIVESCQNELQKKLTFEEHMFSICFVYVSIFRLMYKSTRWMRHGLSPSIFSSNSIRIHSNIREFQFWLLPKNISKNIWFLLSKSFVLAHLTYFWAWRVSNSYQECCQ